jgi:hypothetical protein
MKKQLRLKRPWKTSNQKRDFSYCKNDMLYVLLYGSKTWAILAAMAKSLEAFHNSCVQTISGQPIQKMVVCNEILGV